MAAPVTAPVATEPSACQPRRRSGVEDPARPGCFGALTTPATDIPHVDQLAASAVMALAPITAPVRPVATVGDSANAAPAPTTAAETVSSVRDPSPTELSSVGRICGKSCCNAV